MFYSLTGFIEAAKDENTANKNITEISNILFESYETEEDAFLTAAIFEANNIDDFMKAFQENMGQFIKEYKKKTNED